MPILGAPAALRSGKATVLLGGHDGPVARAEPVAAALSTATKRYPAAAMASSAKLASNLLLLDAVVALAESFTVGRAGGLTDDQLRELLGESPMVPPGLQNRFEAILAGQGPAWWSDALGGKDARLALEVARSAGHDLPVTSAACDQYEEAAREGFAEEDITAVARLYRH
jgi:3-hydroxyisobutyrate dehydrogenase-like beta-hydroxyacid dehydrogenase